MNKNALMEKFGISEYQDQEFNDISAIRAGLPALEGGTYKIGFVPMGDSPARNQNL